MLVLAFVLVLGSLPLAAQDDQINMTMWIRQTSFEAQTLVDEWNANNDSQIELTVIVPAEYVTKMGAAIAAGETPDIASIDLIYTPAFSSAGQLVDVTEHVRALPFADNLTPAHMELGLSWAATMRCRPLPMLRSSSNFTCFTMRAWIRTLPPRLGDQIVGSVRAT